MKRSEINRALRDMEKMIDRWSFKLPPFCYFTPEEWNEKGHEYDEVRDNMLGWDITDFGMGDFDKVGFSLITLRNGNVSMDKYTKPYAEQLLYMKEGQSAAMHFHWNKMKDIINRGGGNVLIGVYMPAGGGAGWTQMCGYTVTGGSTQFPRERRYGCVPERALPSSLICITTSIWSRAQGRFCWARYPCVMTITGTTGSICRQAVFRL